MRILASHVPEENTVTRMEYTLKLDCQIVQQATTVRKVRAMIHQLSIFAQLEVLAPKVALIHRSVPLATINQKLVRLLAKFVHL